MADKKDIRMVKAPVYTKHWAAAIIDQIEDIFDERGISVVNPNPEDGSDPDECSCGTVKIYGSLRNEISDAIESELIALLKDAECQRPVKGGMFS